jgi:hypothetical protein
MATINELGCVWVIDMLDIIRTELVWKRILGSSCTWSR